MPTVPPGLMPLTCHFRQSARRAEEALMGSVLPVRALAGHRVLAQMRMSAPRTCV